MAELIDALDFESSFERSVGLKPTPVAKQPEASSALGCNVETNSTLRLVDSKEDSAHQ